MLIAEVHVRDFGFHQVFKFGWFERLSTLLESVISKAGSWTVYLNAIAGL